VGARLRHQVEIETEIVQGQQRAAQDLARQKGAAFAGKTPAVASRTALLLA
jgi:hypothetical protein